MIATKILILPRTGGSRWIASASSRRFLFSSVTTTIHKRTFGALPASSSEDEEEFDHHRHLRDEGRHDASEHTKDDALSISNQTLFQCYPTALTSKQALHKIVRPMAEYGFTSSNTLLASSICSDEINFSSKTSMYGELSKTYGGNKVFNMGGLGGIPFIGRTGMSAGMDHIPYCVEQNDHTAGCSDSNTTSPGEGSGNLFIFYASHVGISKQGEVGDVERCGQGDHTTTSCGAAVAAYNAIKSHQHHQLLQDIQTHPSWHDDEEAFIIQELSKRLTKIDSKDYFAKDNHMALVSYQMYDIVRDVLHQELTSIPLNKFDHCQHIALLGGIIINRHPDMGDYFQPLAFEVKTKNSKQQSPSTARIGLGELYDSHDLYQSTFGPKPRFELL